MAENGIDKEEGWAAIWEIDARTGQHRIFASGLRNPVGVPDYALGPHTASLGLAASRSTRLPAQFREGMFVGQHGSWNRKPQPPVVLPEDA